MASKKNSGISEKVQEIKRMQKNWMEQRTLSSSVEKKQTSSDGRPGRGRGNKVQARSKETPSKSDAVSWVVGSGSKKKPTSVRARSASPARPTSSKPAPGANNTRPSGGKAGVAGGRPPSTGRPPTSSRPGSSRSDSSSSKKDSRPGEASEYVSRGRLLQTGSEPNLCHRGEDEPSTADNPSSFTTDQSGTSKDNPDQWDLRSNRTSNQSDKVTNPAAFHSESPQISSSQSEPRLQTSSQSHGSFENSVGQSGSRTTDSIAPDAFDKLAEQIASKVRADMKHERNQMMQSVGFTGKSVLEDDDDEDATMSSHKCIKCKQLMVAPDHVPYMLIPCGHTLCEACAEDRIKCCTCRARVSSTAVNTTLQQIISLTLSNNHTSSIAHHQAVNTNAVRLSHPRDTCNPSEYSSLPSDTANSSDSGSYHSNYRDACEDKQNPLHPAYHQSNFVSDDHTTSSVPRVGGHGDGRGMEPGIRGPRKVSPAEQAEKYVNEYQNLLIRCEAMEGEEEEILAGMERKMRDITKQKKQIANIANEQDRLREEVRRIEERIAALDGHRREYEQQCQELEEDKREQAERLVMVRDMLRGLERGKEKIKLLARNYNVSLD